MTTITLNTYNALAAEINKALRDRIVQLQAKYHHLETEHQLIQVISDIYQERPFYSATFTIRDIEDIDSLASFEHEFVMDATSLYLKCKTQFKPSLFLEQFFSYRLPSFIHEFNYRNICDPKTKKLILNKYTENNSQLLLKNILENIHKSELVLGSFNRLLPADFTPTNTTFIRKYLELPLLPNQIEDSLFGYLTEKDNIESKQTFNQTSLAALFYLMSDNKIFNRQLRSKEIVEILNIIFDKKISESTIRGLSNKDKMDTFIAAIKNATEKKEIAKILRKIADTIDP